MEIQIAVAWVEGVERDGGGVTGERKWRGDLPEGLHLLFLLSLSKQPLEAFLPRIIIFFLLTPLFYVTISLVLVVERHTQKNETIDVSKN